MAKGKLSDTAAQTPQDEDAIAKRAYELYLQRGSVPGYETEDWLQAEAELSVRQDQPSAASIEHPSRGSAAPMVRATSRERNGTRRPSRQPPQSH